MGNGNGQIAETPGVPQKKNRTKQAEKEKNKCGGRHTAPVAS